MLKIVVIVGSPRKGGNTDLLADAFIQGAEEAGNQVVKFHLKDAKVNGCTACGYCKDNPGQCAQKDGMQDIYEKLYEADMFVWASPLYFFGVSAQLKAFIDRLYATLSKPLPIKSSAFLLTAGVENFPTDFTTSYYNTLAKGMGWEPKGIVCAGGMSEKGDILTHNGLQQAKELGSKIS